MNEDSREPLDTRLGQMAELLDEIAQDNTTVVGAINRIVEGQENLRADFLREVGALREDFSGAFVYRTLKDLCGELIPPLAAMEAMSQQADFNDPATIRGHVDSLVITLRSVLSRLGAERIPVAPGEELFDPQRQQCVQLLAPDASPFPNAPARTVVQVLEDGYTLGGRLLVPVKVAIQAEASAVTSTSN